MLRTNSKQAKTNIKHFILEQFNYEDFNIPEDTAFPEVARVIWDDFFQCVGKYEIRRGRSVQEAFIYWCSGLPTALNTGAYYLGNNAVDILGDILEQTEEERNKYNECDSEKMLSYLIFREISRYAF